MAPRRPVAGALISWRRSSATPVATDSQQEAGPTTDNAGGPDAFAARLDELANARDRALVRARGRRRP